MRRAIFCIPVFLLASFVAGCSSGGAAGSHPRLDGDWRADMPAMLGDPSIKAGLDGIDPGTREIFLKRLRSIRLDIRGSRLRGGTVQEPGKWVKFRVVRAGRDYLVIRYRVQKDYSPALVRLDFRGANRLRFMEIRHKGARPYYFKKQ